jgi:SNF2 family DNA or RNA helicase
MRYKFKTKPYRHQVAALKKLMELDGVGALLMEPRTGKTKVAIDFVSMAHQVGQCNRVLVVCPSAIMDVWVDEIATHCPFKYTVTIWDKKGRKKVDLPRFGRDCLDFVIINYDAFSTPGRITKVLTDDKGRRTGVKRSRNRGGRFDMKAAFKAWMPDAILLDESHRIKSMTARKSRILHSLGPIARFRIIMTGTAVTKKKRIFDLYSQWKFLNPASRLLHGPDGERLTLKEFKQRFGVWTERNGYPQWLRERNPKTLHKLLHAESFAVARDECFDLPENFPDVIIRVPLEESASVYDQMAEEMVAMIKSGEVTQASIKLVQNLRFAQITSGLAKTDPTPEYPEGRTVVIGSEKLRTLQDLLMDLIENEEKVVICARFRADIQRIEKLCKKLKMQSYVLYGGQKREDRTAQIKRFREARGPAAFIMNPQAGSMGIDLRTASTMIWYSMINSFVDYTQARDRIALSGNANRFIFLLGEGTYDELQYETLGDDKALVTMMMASPERLLRNFK